MKYLRLTPFLLFFFLLKVGAQGEVTIGSETLTLPTYEIGPADKNPVFYSGRVYQGAQGHVYPYPLYDQLTDQLTEKKYNGLFVENQYIKISVLPEIGGRIFSATDKTNGYDFFYRQTGIKPSLIGMLGAWLSGGVEWNIPHHHRPSSYLPVDWKLEENADGSKTIWVGETELRSQIKWSVGVTVHPERSYVEARVKIMNNSPFIQSMLYWANVSVHANENYQVIFAPDVLFGTDHSKVYMTPWPQGEIVRGSGKIEDLSWWKNYTAGSRSIFAWDFENDFIAGYDHGKEAGTVHVANHQVVNGKKFFLWGNNASARMWDKMLSDKDGSYLELMVGAFSDNQPDYSWIGPGEIREFSQFWFPVKNIRNVKAANREGAVNIEKVGADSLFLGFNTTRAFKQAKVILTQGTATLFEKTLQIDPSNPFIHQMAFPSNALFEDLFLGLYDAEGKLILGYSPVKRKEETSLPEVAGRPGPVESYGSVEELYLAGLRLEQFHNPTVNPMIYYLEALKRDSLHSGTNTALGIRFARQAKWEEAEKYLKKAISRATLNYTVTKNPEAFYYLGVVSQYQEKWKEASDAFWKATWYPTFQAPAYFALSQMACREGNFPQALEMINASLAVNARSPRSLTLKAYILRKLGNSREASELLDKAVAIDPLDYWSLSEKSILSWNKAKFLGKADDNRGEGLVQVQGLLSFVLDYGAIGAYDEAIDVLNEAISLGNPYAKNPLIHYYTGYFHFRSGRATQSDYYFSNAAKLSPDYCFPFRIEEIDILATALQENSSDSNGFYYLGNLLYSLEQQDAATALWRKATQLNNGFGLAWRNLGYAAGQKGQWKDAVSFYEIAVNADKSNPRAIQELELLYVKTGRPAKERLSFLETHFDTVLKHDESVLRLISAYNETGNYDKSIDILGKRHFHVWEGGGQVHDYFTDAHLLRGIQRLSEKKADQAIEDFMTADTYPENLEVGRPAHGGQIPKIYYYLGKAYQLKGDRSKALDAFRNAISSESGRVPAADSELTYFRAMAYQELGQPAEASALLASMEAYVNRQKTQQGLTDAYSKFGEEGTDTERLARLHTLSGLISMARGEVQSAASEFSKALQLKPDRIWTRQYLKELE